jgi:glycine hydroxymethyltransferase
MPYRVSPETGLIDYDRLEENAALFRPQVVIAGASAYPRDFDYKRMRKIADNHGAYLMTDMAHYAGLVAAKLLDNPFDYSDIVTTTTHKSLRGPRASMIFYRKGTRQQPKKNGDIKETPYKFEETVNFAVFPSCQGGPHNNTISAVAVAMKEALDATFVEYQKQVVANCRAMAAALVKKGYKLVSGGTDNHLLLWDVRPQGLNGGKMEWLYDQCHITVNKNTVSDDTSALTPGGLRLGTCALTSRTFKEADFEKIVEILHRGIVIGQECVEKAGKKLVDWKKAVEAHPAMADLKKDAIAMGESFPMPGRAEY